LSECVLAVQASGSVFRFPGNREAQWRL